MARVRAKEHELFQDPVVMQRVISLLEREKPITKKEACEMLNISYNTARLNKIIEDFKERQARRKEMRARMRKEPLTHKDKKTIIEMYLSGESLYDISEHTYRTVGVIKNVLQKYHIPLKRQSVSYFRPIMFEDTVKTYSRNTPNDLVYSARYNCPAYVRHMVSPGVYSIWLTGDRARQAIQPDYELADLTKIQKEFGIEIEGMDHNEYVMLINEALMKAKKLK